MASKFSTPYVLLSLLCLALLHGIVSCNYKHPKLTIADVEIPDTIFSAASGLQYFDKIVTEISLNPSVDCGTVGIGGAETEQYKRFLFLKNTASTKQLVALTNHGNSQVRAYSFWALADTDYPDCRMIFEQHIKDTAIISYSCGCMVSMKMANLFYLERMSHKLTDKEMAGYKAKILKSVAKDKRLLIELTSI